MTFMLFLGMANAYIMRTNMSIAIVSMVSGQSVFALCKTLSLNECNKFGRSIIQQSNMVPSC